MQYYLSPYPGVQICELQQCMHIDITHKLKIYNQRLHFIAYFANQEKYQLQMKITFYGISIHFIFLGADLIRVCEKD